MEVLVSYAEQYPLVPGVLGIVFLVLCWKSEEMRGWLVRLAVFLLVLALIYFAFDKIRYRLPSPHQPPAIRDDALTPEDHVGKKYYRDPAEQLK